MAADPKDIEKRLRDQSTQIKGQVDQLEELLAIKDAILDEYDELIEKCDKKNYPMIQEINTKIKAVADAYKARISAGCRSDLAWVLQESKTLTSKAFQGSVETQTWKVEKDPSQRVQINRYGLKYYRYPKDRDYGSNVTAEIENANIDQFTTVLVIFDSDTQYELDGTSTLLKGVKNGDFVTDNLDEPQIFITGNLPTVVGLGTTSYPGIRSDFTGFCTSVDNKIYSDAVQGTVLDYASVGDFIYDFSGNGLLPANGVKITGISTVDIPFAIDGNNSGNGGEVTAKVATIDGTVNGSASNVTFTVGIVSTYQAAFLSTSPQIAGVQSSFTFVRNEGGDIEFDSAANPIDPVKIGTIQGKSDYGKGHKLERQNNGDPEKTKTWREVQEEPEPDVGSSFEEYWVGAESWPQFQESDGETRGPAVYVPEGFTVTISVGGTMLSGLRSMTPTPPPTPNPSNSECNNLDAAITAAENDMNSTISTNTPKIDYLLKGSKTLRNLRAEDQTEAWSYLQGIGYQNSKSKENNSNADEIGDFNWEELDD
jgi:hypothetical protein